MSLFFKVSLIALLALSASPCLAFESKYYFCADDDSEFSRLNSTIAQADFTVSCDQLCAKDLGIQHRSKPNHMETNIRCEWEDARKFLQKQDHKDLIVIWLGKTIWRTGNNESVLLQKFSHFVADLGFKRVLILGASAFGTAVLSDSDENNHSFNRLAFEPGLYYMEDKNEDGKELHSIIKEADLSIRCDNPDRIEVGIGREIKGAFSPIYFSKSEVKNFLKTQRHKQLLVINLGRSIMCSGDIILKEQTESFKTFARDLGYKRVFIIGDEGGGIRLLYDSYHEKGSKLKEFNTSEVP